MCDARFGKFVVMFIIIKAWWCIRISDLGKPPFEDISYGSGHEDVTVLLPGFAIIW